MSEPRKSCNYEGLSEKTKFVIDCYAARNSAAEIFDMGINKFGENEALKLNTIATYKKIYQKCIVERRKFMQLDSPIIDPVYRFKMLDELLTVAKEGIPRFGKGGEFIGNVPDIKNAIAALKLAHDMTNRKNPEDDIADEDIIRQIVIEAFQQISAQDPDLSIGEVCARLIDELPEDARPYIDELTNTTATE